MNKKILMFSLISICLLGLVSAVAYYTMFSMSFSITPAFSIEGDTTFPLGDFVSEGEEIVIIGEQVTIISNTEDERNVIISDNSESTNGDVSVRYVGSLTMVEKDTTTWFPIINGDSETITYTIVGEDFIVNDIPNGYTLIYYPNTEGDVFATNVDNVKVLTEGINDIENLPIALDVGDDYCGNGFNLDATQCFGAKLWLIEGDETTALAKLSIWDTTGFLFETELIQYNAEGNIVMSPGSSLTITPVYTIAPFTTGDYTIETTIA